MKQIGLLMACGVLTLAFGCENRATGPRDSGGIVLMDGGEDAGTPTPDSGPGDTCPPSSVPAPTMAACAAATGTCIGGCADNACAVACLEADPSADPPPNECLQCVDQALIACATANGCDDEWGEVECCAEANCPDGSCFGAGGACAGALGAFQTCLGALPMGTCNIAVCFPPAP